MRKIELRMNEQKKYKVIKELVDHNSNKNRAAITLGITRRQIDRLIIKYKKNGKSAFVHDNRGQAPSKAIDKSIHEDIILLYKGKYQDWNFQHFKDFLEKDEKINLSYKCIYNILTKEGFISPKARRKTKKNAVKARLLEEKKINLAMSNEQILELKELSRNERFSKNFEEVPVVKKNKKYIPPMSHPFKAASFKKYQEKQFARKHIGFGTYFYN